MDYQDVVKRRQSHTMTIRKAKRDLRLNNRRRPPDLPLTLVQQQQQQQQQRPSTDTEQFQKLLLVEGLSLDGGANVMSTKVIVDRCVNVFKEWWKLSRPPTDMVLVAMEALQRLLVVEDDDDTATTKSLSVVQEILDAGALEYMAHFLKLNDLPDLQSITILALTKMAYRGGQQVFQDRSQDVVNQSVRLLMNKVDTIREQSASFLATFTGGEQGGNHNHVIVLLSNPSFRRAVLPPQPSKLDEIHSA
jgi:hypothetical protein